MGTRAFTGLICALALAGCGGGGNGGGEDPPANRAPLTQSDVARTRPGSAVEIAVLANDSDPDGDALTVVQPAAPASGTVELLADNRLRITPATGFAGDLAFTYQARDSRGALSLNTSVTVTVGPTVRAMLGVTGATPRVIVSGSRAGESALFVQGGPCGFGPFAIISSDMRTMIGRQCGSTPTREDLVVMAPRAATLVSSTTLLANAALAPGFVTSPDGATVTVAERVQNPDDLSLPGAYELVRIDVPTRAVLTRLALPGITSVESITAIGGLNRRFLIATGGAAAFPGGVISTAGDVYVADFDTGLVQRVTATGGPPMFLGLVSSPDGRFVFTVVFGDVFGYDLANPGVPLTFWSSGARGELADFVLPAPTSTGRSVLIVTSGFASDEQAIWELPPDDPAAAREVARYDKTWTQLPGPMIAGLDRLLVASDAALPDHSEIREIRVSTGEVLSTLTPPGGLYRLEAVQRLGNDGVLVKYSEPLPPAALRGRIGILRSATPGALTVVAPDLDLDGALLSPADRDGTTFGLTTVAAGVFTPHLVDVNLPAQPFPFSVGVAAGERANVALVFLPPDS